MPKLFTDAYIRALKPKGTRYEVGEPGGLKIRVGTSGKKTWVYTYRQNRRLRRMTLGQYGKRKPALSVAAARAAVATARIAQTEGHDPAASISAERTARKTALTVNDLISEYIKRYARKYKKSWCEDERMLNKDVKKYFGSMLAKDVKRKDILFFLEDLSARAPIAANRTFAVLRKMFNWAAEREIVEMSPCFQVKMPNKTTARDRVLFFAEIRQLWQVLSMDRDEFEDTIPGKWPTRQTRLAIKLALVTAQRRNEIAGARRSEFDLDKGWWTIPAERAKNGISHRVPLSSLAIGIIDECWTSLSKATIWYPGEILPKPSPPTPSPGPLAVSGTPWIYPTGQNTTCGEPLPHTWPASASTDWYWQKY